MEKLEQENLRRLLKDVSGKKATYSRTPELIVTISSNIADIIGTTNVYISEFIIAKIKGFVPTLQGHPEISDDIFLRIPLSINNPSKILLDTRGKEKYMFIIDRPTHEIVVETKRPPFDYTEINTMHLVRVDELKRLERKFPVVYSASAETPMFSDTFEP